MGSGQVGIVPYRAYRTSDGELVVAAGNNKLFAGLSAALGYPEWATDERFATNPDRVCNAAELYALIEACMLTESTAHWMAKLEAAGVPNAPVQNVKQMLEHEQTKALGILQKIPGASIPLIGLPVSFDGQRPHAGAASPALGADTERLLAKPSTFP